jgi:DNA repair ATPase RecN
MNKEELMKPALNSWRELDEKLGDYAKLINERDRISTKLRAQIQKLQGALQESTADIDSQIHQAEQTMNIFVNSRLDEVRLEKKKSMVLTNGTVQTKTIPTVEYPDNETLVAKLKKLKLLSCIQVIETPIKAMKTEVPDLFDKLGIEEDEDTKIIYKLA